MTQQGIEVFLAVARLGSISAAAQALYITQPAVSRHLKSLEDALRVASVGSLVSYLLGPRRKEALTRTFLACLDRELNRRPEIESLLSLPDEPIEGGWLCT